MAQKVDSEKWVISQRWVMAVMGMMGVTMAYVMRGCLAITITQMVKPVVNTIEKVGQKDLEYCPMPYVPQRQSNTTSTHYEEDTSSRFDWDEETQGLILSAFYYGYIITHVPGGLLAQRFGGKHTMGLGILSTAVLTMFTPMVARMGSTQLMILRFVEGLGEGTTFPALCTLLAQWAPPLEKGKLSTLVFAGVQLGSIFANSISGFIINVLPGGWPNVFYFFGGISMVWFVIWCLVVYNDPLSHPFISEHERNYLLQTIGSIERKKDLAPTPWKHILTSAPVWGLIVAESGHGWGGYTLMSDLPKYMSDVLHFSVEQVPFSMGEIIAVFFVIQILHPTHFVLQNGFLTSIPYIAQWITSIVSSVMADWTIKKQHMSVTAVRKLFAIIGTVGPGLGVMCASFVGCDKLTATFFFTLGMALMGFCYPSIRVNALDLSPNYSATIMALVNGIGCLSGMATPYVAGLLTPNRTISEWRLVFWIMLVVMVASSMLFTVIGSGETQFWDDMEYEKRKNYQEKDESQKNYQESEPTVGDDPSMKKPD